MWLIAYALPAVVAGTAIKTLPGKMGSARNMAIVHAALIVSTLTSNYFIRESGRAFPWQPHALSLAAYIASALIACAIIGRLGIWYGASALIQQVTMASATFMLLPDLSAPAMVLLLVPIFVWGHTIRTAHWQIRTIVLTVWGALSVYLFSLWLDFYLLAALHTVFGSILISRSIIHPGRQANA